MKIAITGATGLIGSALSETLSKLHEITPLKRIQEIKYEKSSLEGQEVIIHLAGENIGNKRWSDTQKRKIKESRILSTQYLCETILSLKTPPRIFICASAMGYYGDRGLETLTEESKPGNTFLSEVVQAWEKQTDLLKTAPIRILNLRFGLVLSKKGGALARMLPIFRMGLGGAVGNGNQMISWIALDEIPKIIQFLIDHPEISGPVNIVSPEAISNKNFSKTLATVLRRPCIFPVPALVINLFLGQMGKELLLASTNILPLKLLDTKYPFQFEHLEEALKFILKS